MCLGCPAYLMGCVAVHPLHPDPRSCWAVPGMETQQCCHLWIPVIPCGKGAGWAHGGDQGWDRDPATTVILLLQLPLTGLYRACRASKGQLRGLYLASCLWKCIVGFHNGFCRLLNPSEVLGEDRSSPSSAAHLGWPASPRARSILLPAAGILRKLHSLAEQPCSDPAVPPGGKDRQTHTTHPNKSSLRPSASPPASRGAGSPNPKEPHSPPSPAGCSPRSPSEIQLRQTLFCCHPVRKHYSTLRIVCGRRQNNSPAEGGERSLPVAPDGGSFQGSVQVKPGASVKSSAEWHCSASGRRGEHKPARAARRGEDPAGGEDQPRTTGMFSSRSWEWAQHRATPQS